MNTTLMHGNKGMMVRRPSRYSRPSAQPRHGNRNPAKNEGKAHDLMPVHQSK